MAAERHDLELEELMRGLWSREDTLPLEEARRIRLRTQARDGEARMDRAFPFRGGNVGNYAELIKSFILAGVAPSDGAILAVNKQVQVAFSGFWPILYQALQEEAPLRRIHGFDQGEYFIEAYQALRPLSTESGVTYPTLLAFWETPILRGTEYRDIRRITKLGFYGSPMPLTPANFPL